MLDDKGGMSHSSGKKQQCNQSPWENIQMWMSYKCRLHLQREKSSRFSQKHWCSHIFIPDSTIIITERKRNIFPGIGGVQLCSCVWLIVAPWTAARQASLSFTISQNLLKLMSIESVMPSNRLILLLPSPSALHLFQHHGLFHGMTEKLLKEPISQMVLKYCMAGNIMLVNFLSDLFQFVLCIVFFFNIFCFMWIILKVFIEFCYNIVFVLYSGFLALMYVRS